MYPLGALEPAANAETDLGFRVYGPDELGPDGYPPEWHATLKHRVRFLAKHRCVRCHHPYRNGEHGTGEWSECDEHCSHVGDANGAIHALFRPGDGGGAYRPDPDEDQITWATRMRSRGLTVLAAWRILTVHHLDGNKANCRWWNLAALCQRDHLAIQGKVVMERAFILEHSDWFKPYAAGYYAWKYLNEDLTQQETAERQEELLALERLV